MVDPKVSKVCLLVDKMVEWRVALTVERRVALLIGKK
jgi:hypothetical protein